jgi:nucleoside 2-deoxyribosyltransferase
LWELGYATGLGKKVIIACASPQKEHWFAHVAAMKTYYDQTDARTAFDTAMRDIQREK